jgi:hypothetical protein
VFAEQRFGELSALARLAPHGQKRHESLLGTGELQHRVATSNAEPVEQAQSVPVAVVWCLKIGVFHRRRVHFSTPIMLAPVRSR